MSYVTVNEYINLYHGFKILQQEYHGRFSKSLVIHMFSMVQICCDCNMMKERIKKLHFALYSVYLIIPPVLIHFQYIYVDIINIQIKLLIAGLEMSSILSI